MASSATQNNQGPGNERIAFVGAGNMARSLLGGLLARGYAADNLAACDPVAGCRDAVAAMGNIKVDSGNETIVADADVVILAIKPQVMADVLKPLQETLTRTRPLLISIAAGISSPAIASWAGGNLPVVRCMPNTPALLQAGATAMFANDEVSPAQKQLAENILSAVGLAIWVDEEKQLDVVTAVSGSGPAYFFLLMEAMQAAGESLGLSAEIAEQLTHQTALGAAKMAVDSDVDVAELRRRVTSPNGTTQAALESFERDGMREIVATALKAAADRSVELEKELCT